MDAEDAVAFREGGGYHELWTEAADVREHRTRLCLAHLELDGFPILSAAVVTQPAAALASEELTAPMGPRAPGAFGAAASATAVPAASPFEGLELPAGHSAGFVQLVRFRRRVATEGSGTVGRPPVDQTKLEVGDRLVLSGERLAPAHAHGGAPWSGGAGTPSVAGGDVTGFGEGTLHHCEAGVVVALDGDTVVLGSDGSLPNALKHLAAPYAARQARERAQAATGVRATAANSSGGSTAAAALGRVGETKSAAIGEAWGAASASNRAAATAVAAGEALVAALRGVVFRLDKFETTAGSSTARRSLVHLFTVDARLRDLAAKEQRAANKAANGGGGSSSSAYAAPGGVCTQGGSAAQSLEQKMLLDEAPKVRSLVVNLRPPTFAMAPIAVAQLRDLHASKPMADPGSAADRDAAEQSWLALKLPGYGDVGSGDADSGASQKLGSQRSQRGSQFPRSQAAAAAHASSARFVAPGGCSPARLREDWAFMNVDQRLAVLKAVVANDYALILGMRG